MISISFKQGSLEIEQIQYYLEIKFLHRPATTGEKKQSAMRNSWRHLKCRGF